MKTEVLASLSSLLRRWRGLSGLRTARENRMGIEGIRKEKRSGWRSLTGLQGQAVCCRRSLVGVARRVFLRVVRLYECILQMRCLVGGVTQPVRKTVETGSRLPHAGTNLREHCAKFEPDQQAASSCPRRPPPRPSQRSGRRAGRT
jgi:hypothetical protein